MPIFGNRLRTITSFYAGRQVLRVDMGCLDYDRIMKEIRRYGHRKETVIKRERSQKSSPNRLPQVNSKGDLLFRYEFPFLPTLLLSNVLIFAAVFKFGSLDLGDSSPLLAAGILLFVVVLVYIVEQLTAKLVVNAEGISIRRLFGLLRSEVSWDSISKVTIMPFSQEVVRYPILTCMIEAGDHQVHFNASVKHFDRVLEEMRQRVHRHVEWIDTRDRE